MGNPDHDGAIITTTTSWKRTGMNSLLENKKKQARASIMGLCFLLALFRLGPDCAPPAMHKRSVMAFRMAKTSQVMAIIKTKLRKS